MEISDNGLLKKMKLHNFSEDIIVRLLTDLLIGAGDTVSISVKNWSGNGIRRAAGMKRAVEFFIKLHYSARSYSLN